MHIILPFRHTQNLSICQLLVRGEFCEIIERVDQAVSDFFCNICDFFSLALNTICEKISDAITWLFADEATERAREIRIFSPRPRSSYNNSDRAFPYLFRLANIRQARLITPAPNLDQKFQQSSPELQVLLRPYQRLPQISPNFENSVLEIAKNLLSDEDLEDMSMLMNVDLFALLMVRSVIFQTRSIRFDSTSEPNSFTTPNYFSLIGQQLKDVREEFWNLSDDEKIALVTHIDTEITRVNTRTFSLCIKTVAELPQPKNGDSRELKEAKSAAIENAKKMAKRKVKPNDATISEAAVNVYKEIRNIASLLHHGNRSFILAMQQTYPSHLN